MQFEYTRAYNSYKKQFLRNYKILSKIEKTEKLFKEDHLHEKLFFKPMTCKKIKTMHSIQVINTQYRILFSITENIAEFRCVCDHDEYQRKNKNC